MSSHVPVEADDPLPPLDLSFIEDQVEYGIYLGLGPPLGFLAILVWMSAAGLSPFREWSPLVGMLVWDYIVGAGPACVCALVSAVATRCLRKRSRRLIAAFPIGAASGIVVGMPVYAPVYRNTAGMSESDLLLTVVAVITGASTAAAALCALIRERAVVGRRRRLSAWLAGRDGPPPVLGVRPDTRQ